MKTKQKGYLTGVGSAIITMLWTLAILSVAFGLAAGYLIWG